MTTTIRTIKPTFSQVEMAMRRADVVLHHAAIRAELDRQAFALKVKTCAAGAFMIAALVNLAAVMV